MNNEQRKYIHYGSTEFDWNKFTGIQNVAFSSKPKGGLWGSPVDANYGWLQFCKENWSEKYDEQCNEDNYFIFTLHPEANILHIYSTDDLKDLPDNETVHDSLVSWKCLNFERLLFSTYPYDAIELHLSEDRSVRKDIDDCLYYQLYGWDCDSILVMNPSVIKVIKNE